MNPIYDDEKWLCKMRDEMKPDEYMFPLGCNIGKSYYRIADLSNPELFKDTSVSPSNFHVIFGSIYNMFRKASFPVNEINNFIVQKTIKSTDERTKVDTLFFVFTSSHVDVENLSEFQNIINEYYDMIFEYASSIAKENKKRILESFYKNQ